MHKMKLLTGLMGTMLGACAVSPQTHITTKPLKVAPVIVTEPEPGQWPDKNWWVQYQDETLNSLIEQALKTAPGISTAEARVEQAKEMIRASAAQEGIQVNGYADAARQRLSDNGLFPPKFLGFHWYNQADLGIRASYSFDWWHKQRATLTASMDDAHVAQAERNAAAIRLSTVIASAYFGWQSDQAQIGIARQQQTLIAQRRDIVQSRLKAQLDSADGLHALDMESAALQEFIVNMSSSSEMRRVMISCLLGISSDELIPFTVQVLPKANLHLPDNVNLDLLARRADIDASHWQVEAAQQRLNIAHAEFMPDISINALAGFSSIELGKLMNAGSAVPSVGAALHLPIFDAGRLQAQYGVRAAQLESAITLYNEIVVNAAREVAAQTVKMQQIARLHKEQEIQVSAAEQLLQLATQRKSQGLTDARAQLVAAQTLQQQRAELTNMDAEALFAELEMIGALGGGYMNADVPATAAVAMTAPAL